MLLALETPTDTHMRLFRKLALSATAATFALIAVGGLVRATDSGLGCPGWPRCFGRWVPPLEFHAIIEYSHRLLASVAVVLVVLLAATALRSLRRVPRLLWPSLAAVALILLQAGLGAVVVSRKLEATLVTAHFATAMLLAGVLVYVTATALAFSRGRPAEEPPDPLFTRMAVLTAGATLVLLLVGAYVRGQDAGLAFPDWPLMNGRLVPDLGGVATAHFAHRALAVTVGMLVAFLALRAWTMPVRSPDLVALSTAAFALHVAQVMVGAANVWTRLAAPAVVAHVTLSSLVWGALVALATRARRLGREAPAPAEREAARGRLTLAGRTAAYFQLTKPRIVVLLLVTTVPTMVLAAGGAPSPWLVAATLVGGSLAAGGANAVNCYLDRDIDAVMRRTRGRPVPAGRIHEERALVFGMVLAALGFLWLAATVNVLAAALSLSAFAFYVLVYTLWLKRATDQNIVIGGAAGAVPVLVGWAAITGTIGLPALVLFAVVFMWTPPHFWALALRHTDDYGAAGVPMLPVVRGEEETARHILLYSVLLVAVTLALHPVARMGPIYLASAAVLGALFVHRAFRLWRDRSRALAFGLFRFSITYLALLFAAVALDRLVPVAA